MYSKIDLNLLQLIWLILKWGLSLKFVSRLFRNDAFLTM